MYYTMRIYNFAYIYDYVISIYIKYEYRFISSFPVFCLGISEKQITELY